MTGVLVVLAVLVVAGVGLWLYRHRPEQSIESGISSFRREMRALAPPGQRRSARPAGDHTTDDGPGGSPSDPHRGDPLPGGS